MRHLVIEPIGGCRPWRAAMTPAMKVDATAPMPGVRTPSLPVAGAICRAVMSDDHKRCFTCLVNCEARLNYPARESRRRSPTCRSVSSSTWSPSTTSRPGRRRPTASGSARRRCRRVSPNSNDDSASSCSTATVVAATSAPSAQPVLDPRPPGPRAHRRSRRLGRSPAHRVAGTVRLGMIDAAAVLHFPDTLRDFRIGESRRRRPAAGRSHRRNSSSWLVGGELDLVVCVEPPVPRQPGPLDSRRCSSRISRSTARPAAAPTTPATWGPWVLYPGGRTPGRSSSSSCERCAARRRRREPPARRAPRDGALRHRMDRAPDRSQAEHGDRPLRRSRTLLTRQLVVATRPGSVRDPAVDALAVALSRHET